MFIKRNAVGVLDILISIPETFQKRCKKQRCPEISRISFNISFNLFPDDYQWMLSNTYFSFFFRSVYIQIRYAMTYLMAIIELSMLKYIPANQFGYYSWLNLLHLLVLLAKIDDCEFQTECSRWNDKLQVHSLSYNINWCLIRSDICFFTYLQISFNVQY